MKIGKTRRFNHAKKGSFEVVVIMTDWELSVTLGALKYYLAKRRVQKATKTFVKRYLIEGFSKALGKVLQTEFGDLKK